MIVFLMGHRGSGKSTVLKLLSQDAQKITIDLDDEIEKRHGSIAQIFQEKGEQVFRELEIKTLQEVLKIHEASRVAGQTETVVIALGAGFEGSLPKNAIKIWIRRESDKAGRIFLNRPSLEPSLSPLEEWNTRFPSRQHKYSLEHSDVWTLPEGEWLLPGLLDHFWAQLTNKIKIQNFTATLLPEDLNRWEEKSLYQNAGQIEIRDDLFNPEQIRYLLNTLSRTKKIYFSHRTSNGQTLPSGVRSDWDLSLGQSKVNHWSYSLHDRAFTKAEESEFKEAILKWAPEVKTFIELLNGHKWWLKDPDRRAFLPRSAEGRWRWYRRLFGPQMPIHFLRDHTGSALDQPFIYESRFQTLSANGFAAVLGGAQVALSWSPSFHHDFFAQQQMPFVAIPLMEGEFGEALDALGKLGLRAAAVTSPHKKSAFIRSSALKDENDRPFESLNTLFISPQEIIGLNTDIIGLRKLNLQHQIPSSLDTVIWGGGGMLPILKSIFPSAKNVAARTGAELSKGSAIIWASLRSKDTQWPKPFDQVKFVLDMNYSENSMGRELALFAGCDYVSGSDFFVAQAQAQQNFWRKYL